MRQLTVARILSAQSIAANTTATTSSIQTGRCTGYAALQITNSAGSLLINQQCSLDDTTWYNPADSNTVSLVQVASGIVKGDSKYIMFDPVCAPYTRFQVVEGDSNATILTLNLIFQEEI